MGKTSFLKRSCEKMPFGEDWLSRLGISFWDWRMFLEATMVWRGRGNTYQWNEMRRFGLTK